MMNNTFINEFIQQCVFRINENTTRIIKCLQELNEEEIWKSYNEHTNSIGNIILHLCGNIRQYAISSLGETEDIRVRDKEFLVKGICNKTELSEKLQNTVIEAIHIIENISDEKLLKANSVQGFNLSGIGIIIHVTEHFSYHTGQIAFWVKLLKNKDLGFYVNVDLNIKNRN